ncbi:MAG: hypothetical protein WCI04_06695 [archaeon]
MNENLNSRLETLRQMQEKKPHKRNLEFQKVAKNTILTGTFINNRKKCTINKPCIEKVKE